MGFHTGQTLPGLARHEKIMRFSVVSNKDSIHSKKAGDRGNAAPVRTGNHDRNQTDE